MLLSLNIRDFAIIDELEVELASGMTALTGETGAGKSILLDALGLLLGDRADAGSIRHGAERADIGACFDVSAIGAARSWLAEQELDQNDECQLRRVINREGRSRGYINGSPVPIQSLREFGECLVDIHGQHEHQSLMKHELQRQLLDNHGGHQQVLDELAGIYRDWKQTQQAIEAIAGGGHDRDSRLEFVRFQLQELDELAAEAGEVERLHEEHARLANAGQLLQTCETHLGRLYDDDNSSHAAISHALGDLQPLVDIDAELGESADLINGALIQLEEGIGLLRSYRERLELDPQRLKSVEQRLDTLHRIARKHRIEAETLPEFHSRLSGELIQLERADCELETLEEKRKQLANRYDKVAGRLHRQRVDSADHLSSQVTEAMQSLGMSGGQFSIEVTETDRENLSAHGRDRIRLQPGHPGHCRTCHDHSNADFR
jgi:DNA repair protein RecN (Recombination protein N)